MPTVRQALIAAGVAAGLNDDNNRTVIQLLQVLNSKYSSLIGPVDDLLLANLISVSACGRGLLSKSV